MTIDMNRELLRRVDVFSTLSEEDLIALTQAATELVLQPNDFLFRQNEPSIAFFVIKAGSIRIVRGTTTLAELKPGDIFGEMGVLDDKNRGASAQAATMASVLRITKQALMDIIGERKSVEMKIRRKIIERHAANIATTFHRT